jgi:hypothetical protein
MTGKTKKEIEELIKTVRKDYGAFISDPELSLLGRWINNAHGAVDALQDVSDRAGKVHGSLTDKEIKELIVHVINEHRAAEVIAREAAKIIKGRREVADLLPKHRRQLSREYSRGRVPAEGFRKAQTRLAGIEADVAEARGAGAPSARSDRDGSRMRQEFLKGLSRLVHDITRWWMDEAVASIASVVLDREIQAEQVRNAHRETTRTGRKKTVKPKSLR